MRAPQPQTRPTTPSLLTFGSSDIARNGATLTEPWGTKDWGTMVKGHGGMMDRMDSVIFSAPIFFYLMRYLFT